MYKPDTEKNYTRKKYLLVFIFTVISLQAFPIFKYSNIILDSKDGLQNNTVHSIFKDQQGFMWFGTDLGISRYDGQRFHNYQLGDKPQAIKKIQQASGELFWLQNHEEELICFHRHLGKVIPVSYESKKEYPTFDSFYLINDSTLYATGTEGLVIIHIKEYRDEKKSLKHIILSTDKIPGIDMHLSRMCMDNRNRLFAVTDDDSQILIYDLATGQTEKLNVSFLAKQPAYSWITKIYVYNNQLWITEKWGGLICYDLGSKEVLYPGQTITSNLKSLQNTDVKDIINQDDKGYFAATWNGLFHLKVPRDLKKHGFIINHLPETNNLYNPIIENKMLTTYYDSQLNILWTGTFGGGVMKVNLNDVFYNQIFLEDPQFTEIIEDKLGHLWLSNGKKGILRSLQDSLCIHTTFAPYSKSLQPGRKYAMYQDRHGILWFGDEEANIIRLDPQTEKTRTFQIRPHNMPDFSARINRLFMDSKDRLWLATTKGLVLFNPQTNAAGFYQPFPSKRRGVTSVTEDRNGNIWIGTEEGLMRMEFAGEQITFINGYEKQAGLKPSLVYSTFVNNENQLIASYADKLIWMNNQEKDKVQDVVSLANGLTDGHIFCMINDLQGNTWIGGNSGIMIFKNKEQRAHYDYIFSGSNTAVCRLQDGRLVWSNTWGLTFWDPEFITKKEKDRHLYISDITIHHKMISINEEINGQIIMPEIVKRLDKITLNHRNNNITFNFTDLEYRYAQQKIVYRLLPQMSEWAIQPMTQGVFLQNLKPGRHILEVRPMSFSEDTSDSRRIEIRILPHWSRTWWALVLYVSVSAFIILSLRHQRITRYKAKQKRQKQEIKLKEELFQTHLQLAYRNTIGMQDTCNQLLSIYRQESLSTQLFIAEWDIIKITDQIVASLATLLKSYQVDFRYEKTKQEDLLLWIDKQKIEFIIWNLFSNALRHISYSGIIQLDIKEEIINEVPYCVFSVSDNGKEIVTENSEDLFNPASTLNKNIDFSRMELGLGLIKKIAGQHHGKVHFSSQASKGTKITLYLPSGKNHFTSNEQVIFVDTGTRPENITFTPLMPTLKITANENASDTIIRKKKLLIVDDNKDIRTYLRALLSPVYDIIQATNGQEGIDMALKELPDMILCDIMMPVKDGFMLCSELKENLKTCHIPVIMLTAKDQDKDIIRGAEVGADDYMLKPLNPELLKAKVSSLLKNRSDLKQSYMRQLIHPHSGPSKKQDVPKDNFIANAIEIIEANISKADFSVKKLADMMNTSQPTLYRKIKQSTDFTIIELIRGVRMRKAAILLKQQKYTVQEVTELVGYNDIPTFRKHFTEFFGTTPSNYSKM